ncbi:MAG TPA: LytTR family DNA-binding domain-containing protein [Candidatus Binatia bacterium]|jgi:DNA-binding LytR/AlgR family response regulator|nr:LytTR family DNA-binding domain-containing protein [Candidatus Binatia bacterium]
MNQAGKKILIIDDDEEVRSVLTRLLVKCRFEALAAADGQEGLDLARRTTPDLILCDLEMPALDGYQVLAALRSAPALASVPVIFLTGRSAAAQIRFGMNLGADDYLTKPAKAQDLLQAIQARLKLARVRQHPAGAAVPAPSRAKLEETVLVKTRTEKRLIKIREIIRVAADGEYSWIFWETGKGALLRKSLKQWLAELPADQFIRVHRGAIVNLEHLERVERLSDGRIQIHLRDTPEPIPVSTRLAPSLNRKLKQLQTTPNPGLSK